MERVKEWMKLYAVLVIVLLCGAVLLCWMVFQEGPTVRGVVVEIQTREDGTLASFVLEQGGKRIGVLMMENTYACPRERVSGLSYEKLRQMFQEELLIDTEASVWCIPFRTKLETAEGRITAYRAKSASIVGRLERNALTLRNGTAVDVLCSYNDLDPRIYRLSDGTELLRIRAPNGDPVSGIANGDEVFGALSDTARKKILAYYAKQKPLCYEGEELEKCYAEWRELGEDFTPGYVQPNVWLTAYNGRFLYFKSSLAELPGGENAGISLGAAFDRESGEKLDSWMIFAVSEEELCRRMLELGKIDGESLCNEMAKALKPEWIVVSEGGLTVQFPNGSLPSSENQPHIICVGPHGVIEEEFLQPWAIPYNW